MPSLLQQKSDLASSENQIEILEGKNGNVSFTPFAQKLREVGLFPLKPTGIEIFQINMGKMCNQTCHHCHVDAGPDRKEIMTKETLQKCLDLITQHKFPTVDLTGGAPEMNPNFRWFVTEAHKAGAKIIVRCNLTIILANPKYNDLPLFFKEHGVEVVSSMPHYTAGKTDRQRGDGVFAKSIKALRMLNEVGYGNEGTGLTLNLVHNPSGAFLPSDQEGLERDFKMQLRKEFGIEFNHLYSITNMPISRYLEYLIRSDNYTQYMETLVGAFNATAAKGVMCRNTLSIGWDGKLYDCDFNQMLDLTVADTAPQSLDGFDLDKLNKRNIILGQHCYGCTAGSGSSCGGATV